MRTPAHERLEGLLLLTADGPAGVAPQIVSTLKKTMSRNISTITAHYFVPTAKLYVSPQYLNLALLGRIL